MNGSKSIFEPEQTLDLTCCVHLRQIKAIHHEGHEDHEGTPVKLDGKKDSPRRTRSAQSHIIL